MSAPSDGPSPGFLTQMRMVERGAGGRPRIGRNDVLRDEVVEMGQDPFLGFATEDMSPGAAFDIPPRVRPRFMGFFGPNGALPQHMTWEVMRWSNKARARFVRFTDIFAGRFQQLFYRVWSDARPVTRFDHPGPGGFPDVLRALSGDLGRAPDAVGEVARLELTELLMGRVRTPGRLAGAIQRRLGLPVNVREFETEWLVFEQEDLCVLGQRNITLGQNATLGRRCADLSSRVTVQLHCERLSQYRDLLPGGATHPVVRDLCEGYLGAFWRIDIELQLPAALMPAAILGRNIELGWTGRFSVCTPPGAVHSARPAPNLPPRHLYGDQPK